MFLYLENSEVKITKEGMLHKEVKDLYNVDKRNESKPFFFKALTYIYWAYKKDGEYRYKYLSDRRRLAAEHACDDVKKFEEHEKIKSVIKLYIDLQTTLTERLYLGLKNDYENLVERIKNIPTTRKIKFDTVIEVNGELQKVEKLVEIDNWKEKSEAITMSEKLIEWEEKLRKKLYKEEQEKKSNNGRLFDFEDFNK